MLICQQIKDKVLTCALKRLGFEKLREEQDGAFVDGRDVFKALLTGYGNYFLLYLFDGDRCQDRCFATDDADDSQEAQSKVG